MKTRVRRRTRKAPDLTSLFDVLFIVVFVALIRAASAMKAADTPPPPKPVEPPAPAPPQPPPDVAALRTRALAAFGEDLAARAPLVIRIAVGGEGDGSAAQPARVTAIEADGKKIAVDVPLVEASPDPDVEFTYLGDRSADLRVCGVAKLRLAGGTKDLARYLVIVSPDRPLAEAKHALRDGLLRDVDRCFVEHRGLATIVPPAPPKKPEPDR